MPRKKDTSSVLLQNHIALERTPFVRSFGLVDDSELMGSAYRAMAKYAGSDWNDTEVRSAAAHHALSITERDGTLKKAFAAFSLDDRDPFHWRRLFFYFADAHFGASQTRPGRNKMWSDERWCGLLRDFNRRKRNYRSVSGSRVSELSICKLLRDDRGGRYSEFAAPTILRNLQHARDPKKNKILRELVSNTIVSLIAKLRDGLQKKGAKLDSKWETQIRSSALAAAIEELSTQHEPALER